MAVVYGDNYEKEWINDPSEKADKGTRNASIKCQFDSFAGVANGDDLYIFKLENKAKFLGKSALVGTLGAGDLKSIDKDGNETVIAVGDDLDGQVEGGLIIALEADAGTSASVDVLLQFLMD